MEEQRVETPLTSGVAQPRSESPSRRVHAWLAPGQDWIVEIGGVEIVVRLVERRGRRARVAVSHGTTAKGGS
jgi:hypothetical protein